MPFCVGCSLVGQTISRDVDVPWKAFPLQVATVDGSVAHATPVSLNQSSKLKEVEQIRTVFMQLQEPPVWSYEASPRSSWGTYLQHQGLTGSLVLPSMYEAKRSKRPHAAVELLHSPAHTFLTFS